MKKYISIILLSLITTTAFCQNRPILRTVPVTQTFTEEFERTSGIYVKDTQNHLNPYEGTWRYSQNGVEFTLKLKKVQQVINTSRNGDYYYYDRIISTYKLVKNGVVLIDNLNLIPTSTNIFDSNGGFGTLNNGDGFEYINGIFTDITNNVIISRCEISKISSNKIFFKLYANHSWKRNPEEFYQGMTSMYSMPNNIEMVKIN